MNSLEMNNLFWSSLSHSTVLSAIVSVTYPVFAFWALSIIMQVSLGEVDLFYINDSHDKLT